MPLPRFEKLDPERRAVILDAAKSELLSNSFQGASYNSIIRAAGLSKGAMYYYFADKADLYGCVLDEMLDRIAADVAQLPPPEDAEGFWRWGEGAIGGLAGTLFSDPQLGALARDMYRSAPPDVFARLKARIDEWADQALALGQQLGAVRDDYPRELLVSAATGMLVAIDRWFADAMETLPPDQLGELATRSLSLARDLLAPRSPVVRSEPNGPSNQGTRS
jgi:AcrR family transcriptional regulator